MRYIFAAVMVFFYSGSAFAGDNNVSSASGSERKEIECGSEEPGTGEISSVESTAEKTGEVESGSEKSGTEKTGEAESGSEKSGTEKTGEAESGSEKSGTEETGDEEGRSDNSAGEAPHKKDTDKVPADKKPFLPCSSAAKFLAVHKNHQDKGMESWPLYEIELEVFPENRTAKGRMQVAFAAQAGRMKRVSFMLPPPENPNIGIMKIHNARVSFGEERDFVSTDFSVDGQRLDVELPQEPDEGDAISILLNFETELASRPPGSVMESMAFFRGRGRMTGNVGAVSTDGLGANLIGAHPTLAIFRDGVFLDSPGVAWGPSHPAPPACHILSLISPPGLLVSAGAVSVGVLPEPDARIRHTFVSAGNRKNALALRPEDYKRHERKAGRITIRATSSNIETAKDMSRWARGVLQHYERRFGPYPWTMLEIVDGPLNGAFAGIRGPGLILINDMLTSGSLVSGHLAGMVDPDMISFMREAAVAHQLAHQWFGEIIDVGGVESPGIEEALAWYAVFDYARTVHGAPTAQRLKENLVDMNYHLMRSSGIRDMPAGSSLSEVIETGGVAAYFGICEGKAPGLMDALGSAIGHNSLRAGLRSFSNARFSSVGREELVIAVENSVRGERKNLVAPLFVHWLDETHGDEDMGDSTDILSKRMMRQMGAGSGMDSSTMQDIMEQLIRALGGQGGP